MAETIFDAVAGSVNEKLDVSVVTLIANTRNKIYKQGNVAWLKIDPTTLISDLLNVTIPAGYRPKDSSGYTSLLENTNEAKFYLGTVNVLSNGQLSFSYVTSAQVIANINSGTTWRVNNTSICYIAEDN